MLARKKRVKTILTVAAILVVSVIVYAFSASGLPWIGFGRPKSDPTSRITSLGKHPTPKSDWVEWVSVIKQGNELEMYIQERPYIIDRPWWNPFDNGGHIQRGMRTRFPKVDKWEITVSDE